MSKMIQGRIARRTVESHMADGWIPIKGKGPDGFEWRDGDLLMQIPEEKYNAIQKLRSEPFQRLQDAISKGHSPVAAPGDVNATFEREVVVEVPRAKEG